jgi:hypothetical protein
MPPIKFTAKEASVVLDLLVTISAYTEQEAREQLGWTRRELNAWQTALRKVDDALVGRAGA